jgi:hypothetical protein
MKAKRIEKDAYGNIRYEYRGVIIVRITSANAGHKTWDGVTTPSKPYFRIEKTKFYSIKEAVEVIDQAYAGNALSWQLPEYVTAKAGA